MVAVAFAAVSKAYGPVDALRSFTLDIDPGTTCCLIGPSGCGKSTALRLLAGLDDPDDGELRIGGRRVNETPTRDRGLGLVTQNDTLLPDRRVGATVGLPLELRRLPAGEIDARIRAESRALGIIELLDRRPDQLSGGESRAVQVARALVAQPAVLLLDEPLAHLDPARRLALRADLRRLQEASGVTTLWATVDQADAMAVADRIAVLFAGRLQQVSPPIELYDHPRTLDVATFVGAPTMASFSVRVTGAPGDLWFEVSGQRVRARLPPASRYAGRSVTVGVRPHDVDVSGDDHPIEALRMPGTVTRAEPLGHRTVVDVDVGDGVLVRADSGRPGVHRGDRLDVALDPSRFHLFDPDTGAAVHHPS